MRLAEDTDYTLRVLMYCAAHPQQMVSVGELAERHGVSKIQPMKTVNDFAHQGALRTTRCRCSGAASRSGSRAPAR